MLKSSSSTDSKALLDTPEAWRVRFENIGIPGKVFDDATKQLKDVQLDKWFATCMCYAKIRRSNTAVLPLLSKSWQLILLGQHPKALDAVSGYPAFASAGYDKSMFSRSSTLALWSIQACFDGQPDSIHFALKEAADSGYIEVFALALARLSDLLVGQNNSDSYALHIAARWGNPEAIDLVLKRAPDLIRSKDSGGRNALHHAAMSGNPKAVEAIICSDPAVSAKLWVRDKAGDTPDSHSIKAKSETTASQILKSLLVKSMTAILERNADSFDLSYKLVHAYKNTLVHFITRGGVFTEEVTPQLMGDKYVAQIMGPETMGQLQPLVTLEFKRNKMSARELTRGDLIAMVSAGELGLVRSQSSSFFKNESRLLRDVKRLLSKTKGPTEQPLSGDEVTVLSVVIHSYQRDQSLYVPKARKIDHAVIRAIEASKTFQLLRPQPKVSEGRNISPGNYHEHLARCRKTLAELTALSSDTQRITNKVLDGIEHITKNRVKIVEHVRIKYGELYEVAEDLPLHTDHVDRGEHEAYYQTLERLVENFFGAFYLTQEEGQLKTFCDKVSSGFCFEGKVRNAFEWAADLSEIKPFHELMAAYIKEYLAYEKIMHGRSEEEVERVHAARDFICRLHDGFFCRPDATYAPDGVVTRKGVEQYLQNILCYEKSWLPWHR